MASARSPPPSENNARRTTTIKMEKPKQPLNGYNVSCYEEISFVACIRLRSARNKVRIKNSHLRCLPTSSFSTMNANGFCRGQTTFLWPWRAHVYWKSVGRRVTESPTSALIVRLMVRYPFASLPRWLAVDGKPWTTIIGVSSKRKQFWRKNDMWKTCKRGIIKKPWRCTIENEKSSKSPHDHSHPYHLVLLILTQYLRPLVLWEEQQIQQLLVVLMIREAMNYFLLHLTNMKKFKRMKLKDSLMLSSWDKFKASCPTCARGGEKRSTRTTSRKNHGLSTLSSSQNREIQAILSIMPIDFRRMKRLLIMKGQEEAAITNHHRRRSSNGTHSCPLPARSSWLPACVIRNLCTTFWSLLANTHKTRKKTRNDQQYIPRKSLVQHLDHHRWMMIILSCAHWSRPSWMRSLRIGERMSEMMVTWLWTLLERDIVNYSYYK